MHVKTLQIHWHEKQPIYSADFDPTCPARLATAGGDNNVRIWRLVENCQMDTDHDGGFEPFRVQYAATLSRHLKQVNCVRFSPNGQYLASAGDGGLVVLWKPTANPSKIKSTIFGSAEDDDSSDDSGEQQNCFNENWTPTQHFRCSDMEDVYDLAWSPDSRFVLFGLSDHSIQIWDVTSGQRVKTSKDHSHFVQGVAWDPFNVFLATQSSDSFNKIGRAPLSLFEARQESSNEKMHSMFFDETLVSFFRRLSFSPDGSLLFMPCGLVPKKSTEGRGRHAFYISTRGQLSGIPGIVIDGFQRGIIAIKPHPRLFILEPGKSSPFLSLPYRIVYATASQDTVCIFDTTQLNPIAMFTNLHYGTLTDIAWSSDGLHLLVTATDGFASMIYIGNGDLGSMMSMEEQETIISRLKSKYAPGAIPRPKSQAQPLDLLLNLNSEPAACPSSDFDSPRHLSNLVVPPSPLTKITDPTEPSSPTVNILPVKRKLVVPTNLNPTSLTQP